MKSRTTHRGLKAVSTGVGLSAVIAMAGLGVGLGPVLSEAQTRHDPPAITTGETVTETTAPASPETSVATPPFTVTTPPGFATPH